MGVFNFSYPAFKAHAPCYIVVCGLSDLIIFPHYLINDTILGKKLLCIRCVLLFSLQLFFYTFFILRRTERDVGFHVEHTSFFFRFY